MKYLKFESIDAFNDWIPSVNKLKNVPEGQQYTSYHTNLNPYFSSVVARIENDIPNPGYEALSDTECERQCYVINGFDVQLEDYHRAKNLEIDDCRDIKRYSNITYGGVTFDGVKQTQDNLNSTVSGILVAQNLGQTNLADVPWIATDNTIYIFTALELIDWALKWKDYIGTCWFVARSHKDAVLALTDETQIINYDPSAGWPDPDLGGYIASFSG